MISFKKLLGKEEKFYDLLEASAEEARVSTELLAKILKNDNATSAANIHDIIHTRRKDKINGFHDAANAIATVVSTKVLTPRQATALAISTSIMGVGAVKRFGAVKWGIVERIVWAWVFTLPVCGLLGYLSERICRPFGMQ